jgi:hypothetical protein
MKRKAKKFKRELNGFIVVALSYSKLLAETIMKCRTHKNNNGILTQVSKESKTLRRHFEFRSVRSYGIKPMNIKSLKRCDRNQNGGFIRNEKSVYDQER